jgi:hypothetical protein
VKHPFILLALTWLAVAQGDMNSGSSTSSGESYLDAIISSTGESVPAPVSASPDTASESPDAAQSAPAETKEYQSSASQDDAGASGSGAASRPSYTAGAGPDIETSSSPSSGVSHRVNRSDRYSSTPYISEAAVQETPDIPQFSHKSHIEDIGAECVQCHQTLFAQSVRGVKTGPSMKEICSQCHNGSDAPAEVLAGFSDEKKYVKTWLPLFSHEKHTAHTEDCRTCHRDIYGDMKKIKTPPPMSICTECHNNGKANAKCAVCHADPSKLKPKSHNPRWVYRNGHGTDARYDRSQCRACHADRECYTCHRGQNSFAVHRPGYKFTHGMDARQRVADCSYCHATINSCAQCHSRTR